MNNNLILESSYIIQLPFPPEITAKDFINRRNPDRFSAKGPNAFFIFRKEIVSYLKKNNLKFKMQEVSAIAGRSWKESPPHVKTTYKLIAEEVEILLNKVRNKLNYATERMNMFPIIQHQFVDLSSQTQFYEQNLYTPEFEYESINSESIIDENTVEENINPPRTGYNI
ncbi:1217_t:CDS:2 [Diversispora eburnea]|uniref:1217_t:CDS:1 n=1 Tax=Diversispora eburnea TaxID=1213867 RepID=A0A9N8VZK8_9GLOM|nr:1217_t:CDS:2 [Diversispora eburnea]